MLSWMKDKLNVSRQKIGKVLARRSTDDRASSVDQNLDCCSGYTKRMLVEDTNIFPDDQVTLHIISTDGTVWTVNSPPDTNVATLKSMALDHFFNPVEIGEFQKNYKLIHASSKRVLNPDNSIQDENLLTNEELLLVEKRHKPKVVVTPDDSLKGPTQLDINAATEGVQQTNIRRVPFELECAEDFQTEFRKILISLTNVAAHLLSTRPDGEEIIVSIYDQLDTRHKTVPDPNSIKNLMEMGFPKNKVTLALRLKRNNPSEALEWLLEKGASKLEIGANDEDNFFNDNEGISGSSDTDKKLSVIQYVAKLLAEFRFYRLKEFRPDVKALQALLEMGFAEKDIIDALRVSGNNQANACDLLLGERQENLNVEGDTSLDPEGPIYKALLSNPQIQLGLNNPKVLLAFLSILENPQGGNVWLHDPDTAPVLNMIFKVYHSEKHIINVNLRVETCSNT